MYFQIKSKLCFQSKNFNKLQVILRLAHTFPSRWERNKVQGQLEVRIINFSHMVFLEEMVEVAANLILINILS